MACHLTIEGHRVTLWNRTEKNIEVIKKTKKVKISGIYNENVSLYKVTSNLKEAIETSEVIMITTPADSHAFLAQEIGKVIESKKIIILNPGRTFGAIYFKEEFRRVNSFVDIIVAETQTIIYTARKLAANHVNLICFKQNVLFYSDAALDDYYSELPKCYTNYIKIVNSLIETSIGNVGMVLHIAPMLLNTGWVENENIDFKYYLEGITPTIGGFLEKIDRERIEVSKALGYQVVSTQEWIESVYNVYGANLYESLQKNQSYQNIYAPNSLKHRYLIEEIPCGLVPIESLGHELGVNVENITLLINLAESILNKDFRLTGRKISLAVLKKFMNDH